MEDKKITNLEKDKAACPVLGLFEKYLDKRLPFPKELRERALEAVEAGEVDRLGRERRFEAELSDDGISVGEIKCGEHDWATSGVVDRYLEATRTAGRALLKKNRKIVYVHTHHRLPWDRGFFENRARKDECSVSAGDIAAALIIPLGAEGLAQPKYEIVEEEDFLWDEETRQVLREVEGKALVWFMVKTAGSPRQERKLYRKGMFPKFGGNLDAEPVLLEKINACLRYFDGKIFGDYDEYLARFLQENRILFVKGFFSKNESQIERVVPSGPVLEDKYVEDEQTGIRIPAQVARDLEKRDRKTRAF